MCVPNGGIPNNFVSVIRSSLIWRCIFCFVLFCFVLFCFVFYYYCYYFFLLVYYVIILTFPLTLGSFTGYPIESRGGSKVWKGSDRPFDRRRRTAAFSWNVCRFGVLCVLFTFCLSSLVRKGKMLVRNGSAGDYDGVKYLSMFHTRGFNLFNTRTVEIRFVFCVFPPLC